MAAYDNTVTQNTPKGVSKDVEFQNISGAFFVKKMIIRNQKGELFDLQPIVTSFTITEELFSPVIMFNARIRDNINFFEDFALSGQEIIHIILQKANDKNTRVVEVDLTFLVKEYPNYQKTPQSSVQEYDLIAVSDFAYLSMLKRISRSVKGNVTDNIKKIFEKDLNMKNVIVTDACVSSFDGVLVIQSPLKAIEWLRQKAFDSEGAPFFIFPRISSSLIAITSLTKLLKRRLYKTYQYKPYQVSVPGTPESYEENLDKIINMKSNIKLDKLKQANDGAFSNNTVVTDYAKKSFISKIFNRDKDTKMQKNKLLENSPFGKTLNFITNGIAGVSEPLSNLPNASRTLLSTNSNSNSSGNPNSSTVMSDSLGRIKSYLSNMETLNHQIEVYGDFSLNPGRKIEIKVPKSCNLEEYNKQINKANDPDDDEDKALSGLYLVAVAVHTFSDGKYITLAKIMKDQ